MTGVSSLGSDTFLASASALALSFLLVPSLFPAASALAASAAAALAAAFAAFAAFTAAFASCALAKKPFAVSEVGTGALPRVHWADCHLLSFFLRILCRYSCSVEDCGWRGCRRGI